MVAYSWTGEDRTNGLNHAARKKYNSLNRGSE